jgi:tRNA(adenine34) deaminase
MAIDEAQLAYNKGEVPVGALIIDSQNKVIATAYNEKEELNDPTAHAEILAIKRATKKISDWRLNDCSIVVTLEPCNMCLGAIVHARLKQLIFGAYDPKGGALSLGYKLHQDKRLNHSFKVLGGVRHYESSQILSQFFKERRSLKNK